MLEPELRVRLALCAGGTCEAAIAPADLHLKDVTVDAIRGTARAWVTERPRPLELKRVGSLWRISSAS